MFTSLFRDTITVKRRTSSSQNEYGEETYSDTTIYTNIPARIESYDASTQYRESGERAVDSTIVYTPTGYTFALQDKIYKGAVYLGLISGINTALGSGTSIDHYELILEDY